MIQGFGFTPGNRLFCDLWHKRPRTIQPCQSLLLVFLWLEMYRSAHLSVSPLVYFSLVSVFFNAEFEGDVSVLVINRFDFIDDAIFSRHSPVSEGNAWKRIHSTPDSSNPRKLEPHATSNQNRLPLEFLHTFTVILPSVNRTLDNSNLSLTRSIVSPQIISI